MVVTCLFALGTGANADDSPPRAVPTARGFERAFTSYDAVVEYATGIALAQSAVDGRLDALRAASARVSAGIETIASSAARGGSLFDPDAQRGDRSQLASFRSQQAVIAMAEAQLLGAGALSSEPTAWRMPTEGEITQDFGPTDLWVEPARSYDGVSYAHFHEGIDIAGAWAAPVFAPARARVVFVGRMSDGAEIVVLAHDGGVVTMYAHLNASDSPPPVQAGDEVAAGQRIGTVGLTGVTTGAHLHWAAWRDGQLVDPLSLLPK